VSDVSDADATRMLATFPQKVVRAGKSPDMPDILVASSRGCRACRRGCYEETASVEFKLYILNATLNASLHC